MSEPVERHTIAVLVDNEPGVLARVIGLFSGRGYNIESLTVAEVDRREQLSRITIVTSGTPMIIEQIKAQLSRLVPVHKVHDLTEEGPFVEREMALVKVTGKGEVAHRGVAAGRHFPGARRRYDDRELRVRDDRLGREAERLYRADGAAGAGRGVAHRRRRDRPRRGSVLNSGEGNMAARTLPDLIGELSKTFNGHLLQPADAGYEEARKGSQRHDRQAPGGDRAVPRRGRHSRCGQSGARAGIRCRGSRRRS